MKTYRISVNGQEIEVCAKTMNISRKRCTAYLNKLLSRTKDEYGSYRFFWADVIMLNMITNRILYHSDPNHIQTVIAPKGGKEKENGNE